MVDSLIVQTNKLNIKTTMKKEKVSDKNINENKITKDIGKDVIDNIKKFNIKRTLVNNKFYDKDNIKHVNNYKIIKDIGSGSYSRVSLVENELDGNIYAAKIVSEMALTKKKKFFGKDENGNTLIITMFDDVKREMDIWSKLNDTYITNLYEIIEDVESKKYYMIMDYMDIGYIMNYNDKKEKFEINANLLNNIFKFNLNDKDKEKFIVNENEKKFDSNKVSKQNLKSDKEKLNTKIPLLDEKIVKHLFFSTAKAINYLHKNNVVHRDIKPDNILVDSKLNVKLSDFSLVAEVKNEQFTKTEGNLYFYSPELCQGKKSFDPKPVDIWQLGVTFYTLIFLELPIMPKNKSNTMELLELIKIGKINYYINDNYKHYSKELIDVLKLCLEVDPLKRINSEDLIKMNYFNIEFNK